MDDRAAEAERQKELKHTAIRKQVQKHRAAQNIHPTAPQLPPKSSQERSCQRRLRKQQQRQSISRNQSNQIVASPERLATHSRSIE